MGFDLEKFFSRAAYNALSSLLIIWGVLAVSYVVSPWNYHYTVKHPGQATYNIDAKEIKRLPWGEPRETRIVTEEYAEQREGFWNKMLLFTGVGVIPILVLEVDWQILWNSMLEARF